MKNYSYLLLIMIFVGQVYAEDNFTLYLVRHAEKQSDGKNPGLSRCGQQRARQLATLLSKSQITSIYSTSYQRTRQTAYPLSNLLHQAVRNYSPTNLEQFALVLQQRKENALVVGHSNTTPQLVELLSKQKTAPLTESDYQQLYQIQFIGQERIVTILKQPLTCPK